MVRPGLIEIDTASKWVCVHYCPSERTCINTTIIGLVIKVKLHRSLPANYKVDVLIGSGHNPNSKEINKQLNDKERVTAALENENL